MTRVLQIRRGSTTQNNAFTGMPGEITMDTDKKTIRIHDGETLGGFEIARSGNSFDISTVPAEFWEQTIAQYKQPEIRMYQSEPVPINSKVAGVIYNTEIKNNPKFITVSLVCVNDEAGYKMDDEVNAFGTGNMCATTPNCEFTEYGISLHFMNGYEKYWVRHNQTGAVTVISDENWKILFRVYY